MQQKEDWHDLAMELWPDITLLELTNANPNEVGYILNKMEKENRTTEELIQAIKKLPRGDIIVQLEKEGYNIR
jgi:hypothetical protein